MGERVVCPHCHTTLDLWHQPKLAADVLIEDEAGRVLLIRRRNAPQGWAIPGGFVDVGETLEQAALREAFEEVGIGPDGIDLVGRLTPLHIPVSHHLLHPVVGLTATRPDFRIAEAEVERVIEAPLVHLRAPETVRWEQRVRERPPSVLMDVPYFDVDGVRVWGATAMVLAEFLAVLEALDSTPHVP